MLSHREGPITIVEGGSPTACLSILAASARSTKWVPPALFCFAKKQAGYTERGVGRGAHLRTVPLGIFVNLSHGYVGVEFVLVFLREWAGGHVSIDPQLHRAPA